MVSTSIVKTFEGTYRRGCRFEHLLSCSDQFKIFKTSVFIKSRHPSRNNQMSWLNKKRATLAVVLCWPSNLRFGWCAVIFYNLVSLMVFIKWTGIEITDFVPLNPLAMVEFFPLISQFRGNVYIPITSILHTYFK